MMKIATSHYVNDDDKCAQLENMNCINFLAPSYLCDDDEQLNIFNYDALVNPI